MERETGWWWVKICGDSMWSVVHVNGRAPVNDGFWVRDIDSDDIEWGPYLGKEPQGTVAHALAWARDQGMTAGDIGRMFDEERRILGAPFESGRVLAGLGGEGETMRLDARGQPIYEPLGQPWGVFPNEPTDEQP